jgi:carboxypeptidase C (cathepsin A)
VGVGYSYAGTEDDLKSDDIIQALDAYAAIQLWFKKFPEYLDHELYLTGESYGGVYVPYVAWEID